MLVLAKRLAGKSLSSGMSVSSVMLNLKSINMVRLFCLLVMTMISAEMTEAIVMQFCVVSGMGLRNHVLDRDPEPSHGKGQFWFTYSVSL